MTEKNNKSKYITEEYLDKRFEEQTQVLLNALDSVMEKRLTVVKDELKGEIKGVREELYIVRNELKEDIEGSKNELKKDINNVQILIDGYVKAQEGFRQEFEIMKAEFDQMKKIIKEKLGLDVKAV